MATQSIIDVFSKKLVKSIFLKILDGALGLAVHTLNQPIKNLRNLCTI